jgi:hypothetical protein
MYGFAPVCYAAYVMLLSVPALFELFYVLVFVHFLASSSLVRSNGVLEDVFCFVSILCVLFYLYVYTVFFVFVQKWAAYTGIVSWGFFCLRKYITYEDIF